MRRREILSSLGNVRRALADSGIQTLLERLVSQRMSSKDSSAIREIQAQALAAMTRIMIASKSFGENEQKLMEALELDPLLTNKFWESFLDLEDGQRRLYQMRSKLRLIEEFLPRLERIFGLTDLTRIMAAKEDPKSRWRDFEVLTVTAIETSTGLSTPNRLANMLQSMELLYKAVAEVNGLPDSDLVVASCDSGSDKSFDLLGIAKVVSALKQLIVDLWDRVVFYRERKLDNHLDLITKSLPIIAQIDELANTGALQPEAAELLRRRVSEGVTKFLDSGSMIPELQQHAVLSPRQILAPHQKQLAGPPLSGTTDESAPRQEKTSSIERGNARSTKGRRRGANLTGHRESQKSDENDVAGDEGE